MPTSTQRSRYEARLAAAHRSAWHAAQEAEQFGDEGASEDLTAIMGHLSVLLQDSLKGKKRNRRQIAMRLDGRA